MRVGSEGWGVVQWLGLPRQSVFTVFLSGRRAAQSWAGACDCLEGCSAFVPSTQSVLLCKRTLRAYDDRPALGPAHKLKTFADKQSNPAGAAAAAAANRWGAGQIRDSCSATQMLTAFSRQ